jgi:hypothetical protein
MTSLEDLVVIPWKIKLNYMTKRNQYKASISLLIFMRYTNTTSVTHTSVEGKLINLCMSYRLEMKLFFILKLVANRGFRL